MVAIDFLPADFGYVLLCIVYCLIMNVYLAIQVGKARKKYEVLYPTMYSDKSQMFNCIQRAHQNTLEQLPVFFITLLLVGLAYPKFAAICGAIFVTSRFSYAWGYYTGDPKKRLNGTYGMAGLLGLYVGLIYLAFRQLGCFDAYLP
ncbi:unnamed protein product [Clavelina lepadiformis]|uniref:Microsomal glutathione S-transferase 3 n=1 Tax=Clavelina lepadiformis TaxID=159417 RepID=A0ABP0FW01_CLALP